MKNVRGKKKGEKPRDAPYRYQPDEEERDSEENYMPALAAALRRVPVVKLPKPK